MSDSICNGCNESKPFLNDDGLCFLCQMLPEMIDTIYAEGGTLEIFTADKKTKLASLPMKKLKGGDDE